MHALEEAALDEVALGVEMFVEGIFPGAGRVVGNHRDRAFFGDAPWDEHEAARDWYMRMKSRPSFRPILADHLPGEPPPKHYANLDF